VQATVSICSPCLDLDQLPFVLLAQAFIGGRLAGEASMAETTKLSVEKALNKLRGADAQKSNSDQVDEKIAALEEETRRMREQRLRLERLQRRSKKRD
jgi:hypothetical protein